ncbi:uncharacterized protein LOC128123000 [Peromyscus californicus insignis]|uniref:uncharacterized protein LOC128123000 n=1 Tax=Peromyscus californicus insignis TaxID=564181 RepID=UPI0022A6D577|nr:uncharacterized protein LOC128123000 [Peromyscus californicus insignis]
MAPSQIIAREPLVIRGNLGLEAQNSLTGKLSGENARSQVPSSCVFNSVTLPDAALTGADCSCRESLSAVTISTLFPGNSFSSSFPGTSSPPPRPVYLGATCDTHERHSGSRKRKNHEDEHMESTSKPPSDASLLRLKLRKSQTNRDSGHLVNVQHIGRFKHHSLGHSQNVAHWAETENSREEVLHPGCHSIAAPNKLQGLGEGS